LRSQRQETAKVTKNTEQSLPEHGSNFPRFNQKPRQTNKKSKKKSKNKKKNKPIENLFENMIALLTLSALLFLHALFRCLNFSTL
jgi:hypothetical protein